MRVRTREDSERIERETLAPYAMKSCDSAPREYPEERHPIRTCYQRDRDRIVHCEAFRKLEYKTQVFVIFEGDYYRTRLTHTLEVAQIGRTIGRGLRLNEDLIEAVALAHDLGHPPFGHAGEEILDALMKEGGLGGFNHNRRSFEIVTKHERRYPDFDGLNLTPEVLVGILKHSSRYDVPASARRYAREAPTLEARVVDFADSLAYLNHDIDDGLASGCIRMEDLEGSPLWKEAMTRVRPFLRMDDAERLRYQVVKALIDMQIRDLLEATDARLRRIGFRSSDEVKASKGRVIGFSPRMGRWRDALQDLLNQRLYRHYRVIRMTSKARRILEDLFRAYLKEPRQLPYSVYPRNGRFTKRSKYEAICHYIASMTDRFALDEHKRLFNPYTKV